MENKLIHILKSLAEAGVLQVWLNPAVLLT